jgi:hypothetical protein
MRVYNDSWKASVIGRLQAAEGGVDGDVVTPLGIVAVACDRWREGYSSLRFSFVHGERHYYRNIERRAPFTRRGIITMACRFAREVAGS